MVIEQVTTTQKPGVVPVVSLKTGCDYHFTGPSSILSASTSMPHSLIQVNFERIEIVDRVSDTLI